MNVYQPGNTVQLYVSFALATGSGNPVDPTAVVCRVTDPTGVETDYSGGSITKASVGNYNFSFAVYTSGVWKYRWEGTGSVVAAQEGAFKVDVSGFASPL